VSPVRFPIQTLACIWGRHETSVSRYIDEWAVKWGEAGEDLSVLDITADFLEETYPERYKQGGLLKVCALPDGKDFMINTPRANTIITRAAWSDKVRKYFRLAAIAAQLTSWCISCLKVHNSAVRCISWSTATGLSFEHTDLFFARVSEKRLVELWGPRLRKCPRGWSMLADRGFAGTAHYYPNFNAQLTPKFLAARSQFTGAEVAGDYELCKLRYTCEVAFARVTVEAGLKDVVPYSFFSIIDAMNHWGHANVNLMAPLCK